MKKKYTTTQILTVVYILAAIFTFGHDASYHDKKCSATNALYLRGDISYYQECNRTFIPATLSALFFPLYWSWEFQNG